MSFERSVVNFSQGGARGTLAVVLSSLGYALIVLLLPWKEISRAGFTDFDQYVDYFSYFFQKNDLSFYEVYQLPTNIFQPFTLIQMFSREVLWFELVRWLTSMTGEAAVALRIISFGILFVWALFLLKRMTYGVAFLFLFNPFAIDTAMSGIRNGLGWSLVIVGFMIQSNTLRAALFMIGMFVHSSTLVLAILYYFTRLLSRSTDRGSLLLGGLGIGIFIGLSLTVGSDFVLGIIGDRRQGENYLVGGGSFLQASLWGGLLYLMCTSGRGYIQQNIFVIAVLAWYLTINPFIPWSYRILGAFLPVIAAAAMNLPQRKWQIFISLYSAYMALQYLYWTKLFDYWYPT